MVKDVNSGHEFKSSWTSTVEGAFHKYPNEQNKNVLSVDILDSSIDCYGRLHTKKLLQSKFDPNSLMRQVMRVIGMPIKTRQVTMERSTLDLAIRKYSMKSLNDTYIDWIRVFEVLEYTPHEEHSQTRTNLQQTTQIDMYSEKYSLAFKWAISQGEGLFASEAKKMAQKGRVGLETVIHTLEQEAKHAKAEIEGALEGACELTEKGIEQVKQVTEYSRGFVNEVETKLVDVVTESLSLKVPNESQKHK